MELLKIIKTASASTRSHLDAQAARLQELDHIASIEHSCQRLDLDLKQNLFSNDDYLNYFTAVDDKTRLMVEKIGESYLRLDLVNQPYKSRMARAAFLHHRLMFSIYLKLVVSLAPSKHPQLGNLISRAINNATEVIKWRYLNYQGAPGNVWLQISNLFNLAEKNNLTQQKIVPYPDLGSVQFMPESIASSYIMINMLGSLESLSFQPQQIDWLTKTLSTWSNTMSIDHQYDEKNHIFSVEIDQNRPAKRIRNPTFTPASRFWCMDGINIKIQTLMYCIEAKRTPKQPEIAALAGHIYAHKTLKMVRAEWSLSEYRRQRRLYPRVKTNKTASNVLGFEDTYYQIKHHENALVEVKKQSFSAGAEDTPKTLNDQPPQHAESMTAFININHGFCHIVDESINGLCMHVEKKPNELSIGMMIGVASKEHQFGTKIGIIRSIKTTENSTLRVGVEIISRNALSITGCVEKSAANEDAVDDENTSIDTLIEQHEFDEQSDAFNCLFLPKEFSYKKEQSLILPKHRYVPNGQYQMKLAKQVQLIQTKATLEQHDNWVRVYFDEVAKLENEA